MKTLEMLFVGIMSLSLASRVEAYKEQLEIVQVQEQEEQYQYAPDFSLEDVNGNTVCLDSLVAKGPVLMSFWALWCKMCIKELDALRKYDPKFDSLGITTLAVSQDKARSVPD